MGRQGPCFNCGIKNTPLWRSGPPEKPVLCNACGSRWRIRGTLDNYIPKHGIASTENGSNSNTSYEQGQLPLAEVKIRNPLSFRHSNRLNFGAKIARRDRYPAGFEHDDTANSPSSESVMTFSEYCTQMKITDSVRPTFWNSRVPKRKRSAAEQRPLSPVQWLHWQLYNIMQEPEFSKIAKNEEDVLIDNINPMSSNEVGLGAILLKDETKTHSSKIVIEDNCLYDAPITSVFM